MLDREARVYIVTYIWKFYDNLSKFAEQTYWEPRHVSQSH